MTRRVYDRSDWDPRDPDFWSTEADEDESWGAVIGAFAVLVLFIIAGFLWMVTLWAAS